MAAWRFNWHLKPSVPVSWPMGNKICTREREQVRASLALLSFADGVAPADVVLVFTFVGLDPTQGHPRTLRELGEAWGITTGEVLARLRRAELLLTEFEGRPVHLALVRMRLLLAERSER